MDHVIQAFKRHIRIDRLHPVAQQQTEMMGLAGLTGFENQTHAGARALANQMVVQTGRGQQRRHRGMVAIDSLVRENENPGAILNGFICRCKQIFQ